MPYLPNIESACKHLSLYTNHRVKIAQIILESFYRPSHWGLAVSDISTPFLKGRETNSSFMNNVDRLKSNEWIPFNYLSKYTPFRWVCSIHLGTGFSSNLYQYSEELFGNFLLVYLLSSIWKVIVFYWKILCSFGDQSLSLDRPLLRQQKCLIKILTASISLALLKLIWIWHFQLS